MPRWKELKRFCDRDGWELYKDTDHYFYRKIDENGNILEKVDGPIFETTTGEEGFENLYTLRLKNPSSSTGLVVITLSSDKTSAFLAFCFLASNIKFRKSRPSCQSHLGKIQKLLPTSQEKLCEQRSIQKLHNRLNMG